MKIYNLLNNNEIMQSWIDNKRVKWDDNKTLDFDYKLSMFIENYTQPLIQEIKKAEAA